MGRVSRRTEVIDGLLDTLSLGSIVSATVVAPNLIRVLGKFYSKRLTEREKSKELRHIISYMRQKRLVTVTESGEDYEISITEKGTQRITQAHFERLSIPTPSEWDGRWRVVIYDIPEKYGTARRALTTKLQYLGFKMIQRSVWVHPFPCIVEIELIKHVYPEVAPYVVFLETDNIDSHNNLVKKFSSLI